MTTALICLTHSPRLSFRATHLLGQVETRNDHVCVAPALLPVLDSSRRTLSHRQECLCHTIPGADEAFVIGSGERRSGATEDVVEKSRPYVLCHADPRRSPQAARTTLAGSPGFRDKSPGRNSPNQCCRAIAVGISPLALGPLRQAQGPSWSVEMTDIGSSGEPSILMPVALTG